jgi:hypothetical protein
VDFWIWLSTPSHSPLLSFCRLSSVLTFTPPPFPASSLSRFPTSRRPLLSQQASSSSPPSSSSSSIAAASPACTTSSDAESLPLSIPTLSPSTRFLRPALDRAHSPASTTSIRCSMPIRRRLLLLVERGGRERDRRKGRRCWVDLGEGRGESLYCFILPASWVWVVHDSHDIVRKLAIEGLLVVWKEFGRTFAFRRSPFALLPNVEHPFIPFMSLSCRERLGPGSPNL